MAFTRGSTLRGPAYITFGGQTIRTAGDIKVVFGINTFDVPSSEFGTIDKRRNSISISLTFTPVGIVSADMIPVLWPHLALNAGDSLFGASDDACVISPLNGSGRITLHNCAVTKMPNIVVSATKTSIGECTITSLLANATDWSNAAARFTYAPSFNVDDLGAIDTTAIPTMPARVQWGSASPWTTILSGEGVDLSFDMATTDEQTDEDGIVDMFVSTITPSATFIPIGATEANWLARLGLQGTDEASANVLRGTPLTGKQLTVAASRAGGLQVVVPNCTVAQLPFAYGLSSRRIGAVTLTGFRTSGAAATITVVA